MIVKGVAGTHTPRSLTEDAELDEWGSSQAVALLAGGAVGMRGTASGSS